MPAASINLNRFIMGEYRPAAASSSTSSPSWLTRVFRALQDAQMRRAEAEIGRLIEARGGRFTDALEREIERHVV